MLGDASLGKIRSISSLMRGREQPLEVAGEQINVIVKAADVRPFFGGAFKKFIEALMIKVEFRQGLLVVRIDRRITGIHLLVSVGV